MPDRRTADGATVPSIAVPTATDATRPLRAVPGSGQLDLRLPLGLPALSLVPEWDTLTACRYLAAVHPKGLAAEGLTRPDTSGLKRAA